MFVDLVSLLAPILLVEATGAPGRQPRGGHCGLPAVPLPPRQALVRLLELLELTMKGFVFLLTHSCEGGRNVKIEETA